MGIAIIGNGTITHKASSTDKAAVYEAKRRGFDDQCTARLWVGKDVTIVTNANLIYVQNSMDENDTSCCPRVKIYGNVTANRLMYASNALRRSNFEIFEGSNITLKSTELFKSDYSSTSRQVNVFIYGGNFTLQENSIFYDVIDKFGYEITGGTFN